MVKSNKTGVLILPTWLQKLFILALAFSVLLNVIMSIFFFGIGRVWVMYMPFVAPVIVSLVIFTIVLDRQKPIIKRLFISLFFYEIVNLIGLTIMYLSSFANGLNIAVNDAGISGLLIYGGPSLLFLLVCLGFVLKYRTQINDI